MSLSFADFPQAINNGSIFCSAEQKEVERQDAGYTFSVLPGKRFNSIEIRFALDTGSWEMPPKGKTVMLRVGPLGKSEDVFLRVRLRKLSRSSEGFVLGRCLTPGTKTLSIKAEPELVSTHSERERTKNEDRQQKPRLSHSSYC